MTGRAGALVQVLVVSHAGHDRDSLEDLLGSEKEMVPVCPLVAPVDQVAGQQDEFDSRMAPVGGEQAPAPVLKSGLGITHVKEFDSSGLGPAGLGGSPRSPALVGSVGQRIEIGRVGTKVAHGRDVPPDHGIVQQVRRMNQGRRPIHCAHAGRSGSWRASFSADSNRAGRIRIAVFRTPGSVLQLQTSSWLGSEP